MERQELIEIIRRAIQTEKDGNRFYSRVAEASRDAKAKKMFEQLARDELYHVQVIGDLYHDLLPGAPEDPVKGYPIFEKQKKESGGKLPDLGNEYEVLQKAIGDEIEARDFYRKTAESFGQDQAKEVFLDLMEMEQGHIRLLQAELDFLEKTGFYFDHMEFTVEGERD